MNKSNYNPFNPVLHQKKQQLLNSPCFTNLQRVDDKLLNKFSKAIITLWPDSYKDWQPGRHFVLKNGQTHFEISLYCTTYNTTEYFDIDTKEKIKQQGTNGVMLLDSILKNNCKIIFRDWYTKEIQEFNITLDSQGFFCNGKFIKYNTIDPITHLDLLPKFTMTSLVSQMIRIKGPEARKLGNLKSNQNSQAQSARATKHWLLLEFHHPDNYNEEKKNMLSAYNLAKAYGYTKSRRTFERMVHKEGDNLNLRLQHPTKNCCIYIKFLSGDDHTHNNNNTIYNKIDNIDNLNCLNNKLDNYSGHGHAHLKDNHKKITRRSKNLPCGHKACPINNLVKINKIVKAEKWRKYNQIITEVINY